MYDSSSLLAVSVVDIVNHFYIVPFSILSIFPAHLIKCLLQVSNAPVSIFITKLKHPLPPPYSTIPIRFASHHDAVPKSPSMTSPAMLRRCTSSTCSPPPLLHHRCPCCQRLGGLADLGWSSPFAICACESHENKDDGTAAVVILIILLLLHGA